MSSGGSCSLAHVPLLSTGGVAPVVRKGCSPLLMPLHWRSMRGFALVPPWPLALLALQARRAGAHVAACLVQRSYVARSTSMQVPRCFSLVPMYLGDASLMWLHQKQQEFRATAASPRP